MGDREPKRVGTIGNYYGYPMIKVEDGKHYWGIEDQGAMEWEVIPEYLYISLDRFAEEKKDPPADNEQGG